MAKGQQKKSREEKKPKQDKSKSGGGKSAYATSMGSKSEAAPFGKKK